MQQSNSTLHVTLFVNEDLLRVANFHLPSLNQNMLYWKTLEPKKLTVSNENQQEI